MRTFSLYLVTLLLMFSFSGHSGAQQNQAAPAAKSAAGSAVPHLIKFSGTLLDRQGQPLKGPVGVTFSLYALQSGDAPLWMETQNVEVDAKGGYAVLLGANSATGVPEELFRNGEARWLGVQPEREAELPRVMLVSVPYALKAGDAQTLGGLPPSAFAPTSFAPPTNSAPSSSARTDALMSPNFVTAAPLGITTASIGGSGSTNFVPLWINSTTLGNSLLFQTGGKVGVGTITPAAAFDVHSTANSLQGVTSSSTGIGLLGDATSTTGATFGAQGLSASTSGVGILGKNTAANGSTVGVIGQVSSATGTAGVFNNQGGGDVFLGQVSGVTKFAMDKNGDLTIANGDLNVLSGDVSLFSGNIVFPDLTKQPTAALITKIDPGPGLSGGGSKGTVTLNLNTAFTDALYLRLTGGPLTGGLTGTTATFSAGVSGNNKSGDGVSGSSSSGFGLFGTSNSSDGVKGQSNTGNGVAGFSGGSLAGVSGSSASGDGVQGISSNKFGVHGTSTTGFGVVGDTTSGVGIFGQAGTGSTSIGVEGSSSSSSIALAGLNTGSGTAVSGLSSTGNAVVGTSQSGGIGVQGTSTGFRGVVGNSDTHGGVVGFSASGDGTSGISCSSCSGVAGIFGMGHDAGLFQGNVGVSGTLAVSGLKSFHIDHPLDPANRYLNHAAVESSEVLNIYSGNVTTDPSGMATVELPSYFSALNRDFRYQLTVIGQFAQAIVLKEIENNGFVIKTDKPSVKVSWQITALRQDAWVKNHPMQVEEDKPEKERGYYLNPELFGQPEEKGLSWLYHPATMRDAKALWSREKTSPK